MKKGLGLKENHEGLDARDFDGVLRFCKKVVYKSFSMPILMTVNVMIGKSGMTIRATDLEVSYRVELPCEGMEKGEICVPLDLLVKVVANSKRKKRPVFCEILEGDKFRVNGSFEIQGMPPDDFPLEPESPDEFQEINLDNLRYLRNGMTSDETTRYNLAGVYLDFKKKRMVATDGNSMYFSDMDLDIGENLLISSSAVNLIAERFLSGGKIEIGEKNDHIFFRKGNELLISRSPDFRYPDYSLVIPNKFESRLKVNNSNLGEVIKEASIACDMRWPAMRMDIDKDNFKILSSAEDLDYEKVVEFPFDYEGPEISIGMNCNYLLTILQSFSDDSELIVDFTNEKGPFMVKGDTKGLSVILMPMKV